MVILEITIQRKAGDACPVVIERSQNGALLAVRAEDTLRLDAEQRQRLLEYALDPLAYGTVLGEALFNVTVRDVFISALNEHQGGLRVLLVVEDPELKPLHWERLCAPIRPGGLPGLLLLDQRALFSLYLPSLTDRRFPAIGRRDLRALVLVANPPESNAWNLSRFDEQATVTGLQAALGEIPHDFLANVPSALGPPTLESLMRHLTGGAYTLLHLVAHGHYDSKSGETLLFLLDAKGEVAAVKATQMIDRLDGIQGLPHCTFLATCESARPEAEAAGAMGGLAQRLVRELGLPAVVAMTQRVSISTATTLAQGFYVHLREHGEIDRALVQAATPLAEAGDITVPVLYSRLGGRPLFSDAQDRDLTDSEIKFGLAALEKLLPERAPILQEAIAAQAAALRRALGANREAMADILGSGRDRILVDVNATCEEVLDLNFRALALQQKPPTYDNRCPFRGLYPFRVEDREFFFGRQALINKLRQKLAEHNLLAILGSSGCGKSSLVLAGLIPSLQEQEPGLSIAYLTPGSDPVPQLAASLARTGGNPRIIVVDQFEELFTLCTAVERRRTFLDRLLPLAQDKRVIITMRADFLSDCTSYSALKEAILAHLELIAPMDAIELRSAVEQQAKAVGLRFEADLVNTILDDVQGEPGAMPLLQHALLELWKRRHGRWLLAREYRTLGGIQQAIARTADSFYDRLTASEQQLVRNIFVRLTRLDEDAVEGEDRRDTRRRVSVAELVPTDADRSTISDLVQRLADERLVVTSMNQVTDTKEVEVAHEALLQYWKRLRDWLEEDRAALRLREGIRRAAAEWLRNDQTEEYLDLKGRRLEKAEALLKHPRVRLNAHELAYLTACLALHGTNQAHTTQRLVEAAKVRWKRFETGISPEYLQIRIFARQPEGYPVKMLLGSGSLNFPAAYLDPAILPWTSSGVAAQDGERLFDWLFADKTLRDAWTEAMAESPLRLIRLWIDPDAAELQSLCWELLRDTTPKALLRDLAGSPLTPFVRYLPGQSQPGGPTLKRSLNILAVIPAPHSVVAHPVDTATADAVWESLRASLAGLPVTLTRLPPPCSLAAIEQELAKGYHVLHFVGCAAYQEASNQPTLSLADEQNCLTSMTEGELIAMFQRQSHQLRNRWDDQLRLIVLNDQPIENASSSAQAFRARAIDLVMAGVPAVLAVQARLPSSLNEEFTRVFYHEFLQYGRVDVAANAARATLLATELSGDVIPICFTRLRSGLLLGQVSSLGEMAGA